MKKNSRLFNIFNGRKTKLTGMLLAGVATFSVVSCADNDFLDTDNNGDSDALVSFTVSDAQTRAIAHGGGSITRGAINPHLSSSDLASQKLQVRGAAGADLCLIETTVEGVNPVQGNAQTRANVVSTITSNFSASGHRGATESAITAKPEWFYNKATQSNGKLVSYIPWAWDNPHGRFYAVYPQVTSSYSKIKLSPDSYAGNPYVEFEVEQDVKNQKDLMTACTGNVHYATRGTAPETNLDFRHALTAVKFAVGQNLSWNKTIDKVEIRGALSKGKYTLSDKRDGTGAGWDASSLSAPTTFSLTGLSVSTSANPNTIIMGKNADNYTFYMIPQTLTGKNIKAYIHFTDNTEIEVPLKGSWVEGTTKTYKLSQNNSSWNYVLTTKDPTRAANYDETTSQVYEITSYREDPTTYTKQPVAWKVIGYDADGDGNFSMAEKPTWLTALSKDSGNGGTAAEQGNATLKKADMEDLLKKRNDGLKNATPLGSASSPYNLSNSTGAASVENTANCYVISAPGYYRIPLVYGNAIENSITNSRAYISSAPVTMYYGADMILHNFKDHNGKDITDPWIEKSNIANTGINGAKIVWADIPNSVHLTTTPIVRDASGNAYLEFEVKQSDIQSGNAVIAVTKNGTVVWSWHLWFAPSNVLDKIEITNYQGIKYKLTTETLGWRYIKWERTPYSKARTVKVKIEQIIANNGDKQNADITITQKPGLDIVGYATGYQWGRKDAFPGTNEVKQGNIVIDKSGGVSIIRSIQLPNRLYAYTATTNEHWDMLPPTGYSYINLWSSKNTKVHTSGDDDPVIKTVYDPCPAGFKVPVTNIFTGFTKTGGIVSNNVSGLNIDEEQPYSYGAFYWTNNNKTATIFLPSAESREANGDLLTNHGQQSLYWTAMPKRESEGMCMIFWENGMNPRYSNTRAAALSVRPMSE